MILTWLKSLVCKSPSDLFQGDAHAVFCKPGLSEEALSYLSVPSEEWSKGQECIGISTPKFRKRPAWLPIDAACWYFRSDLPMDVLMGKPAAWAKARVEQVEAGIWCVWFPGFSGH